jgi:uncharacterized protein (DUF849 family)
MPGEHPAVPVTAAELAADSRRAVAAGADELHVHPRTPDGRETLEPEDVGAVVCSIRESCPGVPLGLTTGLWIAGGDAARRLRMVGAWEELPDYVSANVSEPGFAIRIRLEDTTMLADGAAARDNAELVAVAAVLR